jgi:hypothetical protein
MQPAYWFNWQRDNARSGRELAAYWNEIVLNIDWSNMSCCPTPEIRVNDDGSISVSTDGGATWHTDNSQDPRYTAPQFPPLTGEDGDTKKCKAANNIVRQMKDVQIGNAAAIGTRDTVLSMAVVIIGLAVAVFASAGLAGFLIAVVFRLAAALLATTAVAYNALFTDDVWSWLLCELYCNMGIDGSITAGQFSTIKADATSHFTGDVLTTFQALFDTWQTPGINNAARIPTTDNLDCSGCSCGSPCSPSAWAASAPYAKAWIDGRLNAICYFVSSDANSFTLRSADRGDGQQIMSVGSLNGTDCCNFVVEWIGGTPSSVLKFGNKDCAPANRSTQVPMDIGDPLHGITQFFWQMDPNPDGWTAKFTFVT